VDYSVEDDDPSRDVPNPAWDAIDAKYRAAMTGTSFATPAVSGL
jgi:subtilisin family serine protease